jgi:hypothetical protein
MLEMYDAFANLYINRIVSNGCCVALAEVSAWLRSQLHCYSRMASLCHWHRLLMFITSKITVLQSASTRHEAFVLKSCLTPVRETLAHFLTHGCSISVYQTIKYQLSKAWEGGVGQRSADPRAGPAGLAQETFQQHGHSVGHCSTAQAYSRLLLHMLRAGVHVVAAGLSAVQLPAGPAWDNRSAPSAVW